MPFFNILKSFIYPQGFITFDRMRNNKKKNELPAPALEPPHQTDYPSTLPPAQCTAMLAPFKLQPIFLSLCIL